MIKIRKLYPLGDQGFSALYNFLFVLISSILLGSKGFLTINTIFLSIMFMVNLQNALVLQPFMKEAASKSEITRESIKFSARYLLNINLTALIFLAIFFVFNKINFYIYFLTIIWLFLITFNEFVRRIIMVLNKWNYGFYFGFILNLLTWGILLLIKPRNVVAYLSIILFIFIVLLVPYFIIIFKELKGKVNSGTVCLSLYKSGGLILLGSAIAFWFISGGYLLLVSHFIPLPQSTDLRKIQNLFNGIMLVLTALDNFLLAGKGTIERNKINSLQIFLILFNIGYGCLVYFAIKIFYSNNDEIIRLLPIWICFYIILSLGKLWISVLKNIYITRAIFLSQFFSVVVYIVLILILKILSVSLNSLIVSSMWIPSSMIIIAICLLEKNKIVQNA